MSHPIVQNTKLKCDKGTKETPFQITSQTFSQINGKLKATEEDKRAITNIIPFGVCKLKPTSGGYLPCIPALIKWQNTSPFSIEGKKQLTTDSYCKCSTGGTIKPIKDLNSMFVELIKKTVGTINQNLTPQIQNNLNSKIEPGYYYEKNGNYLGYHSGKNDNKIHIAKSVKKDKSNNIISVESSVNLTEKYAITHSQVLDRANWIYAEGGYKIPEYYAYSIENSYQSKRIANKNEDKLYFLLLKDTSGRLNKDKYFSGMGANKIGRIFWDRRKNPSTFDQDMKNTIASVIKSKMHPEKDPTGGTNSWLGYKNGKHIGEYFIYSLGRRHFFIKYGESKFTEVEKKYVIIP